MNIVKNKEILIIYNSEKLKDRKALAYAMSLKNIKIKTIDLKKEHLTETQLKRIALELNVQMHSLIDKQSPANRRYAHDVNLSERNLMKILKHHPSLMKSPIVLYHKGGEFVRSSYDFVKKGMHFR